MASSLPKVGIEAVIQGLQSFESGGRTINKVFDEINTGASKVEKASSSLSGNLGGLGSSVLNVGRIVANASTGVLGGFASSLGDIATIAGGIVTANIFNRIAEGVSNFASVGLEAVSHAQVMEASFGALLTQNNLYQQVTETATVAVGDFAKKQAEAAQKSADLAFEQEQLTAKIEKQKASIQEQKQRVIDLTAQWGAEGLATKEAAAELGVMEVNLKGMQRELQQTGLEQQNLTGATQQYETTTKTTWKQVMSMADAQKLAKDQTKELLGFVEKLAIVSPFEQEDVEKVTQYAIGAGLAVDTAQEFTTAFLDWSAAVGITSANLDEAAYQLLQIKKAGTITAVDLRQLTTRGLDLAKVIGVEMGMSVDEFNEKAKTTPAIFDELIGAIIRYSNNTFAGTSQAMSSSIEGFRSTINDLFTQSAKKVLRPLVDAVSPTVSEMISKAADFISGGGAEKIGQQLADTVMSGFRAASTSIGKVMGAFNRFGVRGAAVSILGQLGLDQNSVSQVTSVIDAITTSFGKISQAYSNFGIRGATTSILGQLGLDPKVLGDIKTTVSDVVTTITSGFNRIKDAYNIFGVQGAAFTFLSVLGFSPETLISLDKNLTSIIDTVTQKFNILKTVYDQFGLQGAGISLLSMLGLSSETIATITSTVDQVYTVLSSLGSAELIGGLTGVGTALAAIVAGGVIASIVAGLMSIMTPINLIVVGMGVLFAAWQGNWGGIQEIANQALATLTTVFSTLSTTVMAVVNVFTTTAWPQLQQAFANINQGLSNLGLTWGDIFNALLTSTGIVVGGIVVVISGLVNAFASGFSAITSLWATLMQQINTFITGVTQSLVGVTQVVQGIIAGDWAQAWLGFTMMVQGAINQVKAMLGVAVTLFVGPFAVIVSTIEGFVSGVIAMFTGLYNTLVGHSIIPDLINGIVKWFKDLPQKIITGMGDLSSKLSKPFKDAWKAINEAINIDEWSALGTSAIEGLLEGMKKRAADVLEFIKGLAMDSLQGLGQFWGAQSPATEFMPLGASAMQGIVAGAKGMAGQVTSTFKNLGQGAIDSLMTGMTVQSDAFKDRFIDDLNMGGFLTAAGAGGGQRRNFRNIIKNAIQGNMHVLEAGDTGTILQLINREAARFHFPPSFAQEFTRAEGLVQHLQGTFGTMFQKMRLENLSASTSLASQFASIGKNFADMVTEQVSAFQKMKEEAGKLGTKLAETTQKVQDQETKLQSEQRELDLTRQKLTDQTQAQDALNLSLTEAINKYGEDSEEAAALREKISDLQLQIDKTAFSVDEKVSSISRLTEELAKNKDQVRQNEQALANYRKELERKAFAGFSPFATDEEELESDLAMIEMLQEFLAGTGNELRIIGEELGGIFAGTGATSDIIHTRLSAQQELNQLLAEQAAREQEILNLEKAQKQLDFLGNQLNLLKMISDRGLNPANILGGIRLGIDASAQDLLAATNAVVQAMVNQINSDLQIHSPSAVMARIGQQMMTGLQGGIASMAPVLNAQLSASVAGPISPMMAGMMGAGSSTTNIHNWNLGGNTISSGMTEAEFDARVIRAIQRNL